MNVDTLMAFLGWCAVLNFGLLILSTLMLTLARPMIIGLHSRLTGVDAAALPALYFTFLGNYKLAVIVFNLTPYIALKIIT